MVDPARRQNGSRPTVASMAGLRVGFAPYPQIYPHTGLLRTTHASVAVFLPSLRVFRATRLFRLGP